MPLCLSVKVEYAALNESLKLNLINIAFDFVRASYICFSTLFKVLYRQGARTPKNPIQYCTISRDFLRL